MNALTAAVALKSCWVVIVDETGPIGHSYPMHNSTWPSLPLETLLQLAKAAHPGLPVVSVKWAERPRDYTISDAVLLVSIPGTHALPPKPTPRKARKAVVVVRDYEEETDDGRDDVNDWRRDPGMRGIIAREAVRSLPFVTETIAPVLNAVTVVNTCTTCGTAYTEATWAELELTGTKDIEEGSTIIHEDYRRCGCGSTRMIFTTRVKS